MFRNLLGIIESRLLSFSYMGEGLSDSGIKMFLCLIPSTCFQWLSKASGEDATLRAAIDLKQRVRNSLDKFDRINIIYEEPSSSKRSVNSQNTTSREDDSDLVSKPQVTHPEWKIDSHSQVSTFDAELDPTTSHAQIAKLRKRVSDAR